MALLSVLSPALLSLSAPYNYVFGSTSTNNAPAPTALDFTKTRRGQVILHYTSLIGIIAYLVPSPGGRLALVFVANIAAMMRQAVAWSGIVHGNSDVSYQAIGMLYTLRPINHCDSLPQVTGLGVIVSSVAKQANRSNNPGTI